CTRYRRLPIFRASISSARSKINKMNRIQQMTTMTLVPTLPRSIYIEPTSRCNELCQQCPRTLLSREDDRDLSFDNFRYIVDQFPVLDRVVLHGLGEPLLNKALPEKQNASKPAVSLWFTALKENLHELPGLIDLASEHGIREVYLQRLVYFEQGLAHSKQALFRRSTPEELELVHRCEQTCKELGITFSAAGATTPLESLVRDFGDHPWSGCRRPYTLTYITSSGNVLSCCFAPFGHRSAKEYREERVLGNIFQEPIQAIWSGERYQA